MVAQVAGKGKGKVEVEVEVEAPKGREGAVDQEEHLDQALVVMDHSQEMVPEEQVLVEEAARKGEVLVEAAGKDHVEVVAVVGKGKEEDANLNQVEEGAEGMGKVEEEEGMVEILSLEVQEGKDSASGVMEDVGKAVVHSSCMLEGQASLNSLHQIMKVAQELQTAREGSTHPVCELPDKVHKGGRRTLCRSRPMHIQGH
eukprot:TRINITY_DN2200_c0_g1_i4.p3 TRINITY_DN2200_c0_g1~~TRINITY_DN2200_c0_g1_i4.p3  ORF type:complete len:200 (-),score=79.44 TRINITY_DN2200_c0_g1_i4:354-953(-)